MSAPMLMQAISTAAKTTTKNARQKGIWKV
jgi:hypothetical protein